MLAIFEHKFELKSRCAQILSEISILFHCVEKFEVYHKNKHFILSRSQQQNQRKYSIFHELALKTVAVGGNIGP